MEQVILVSGPLGCGKSTTAKALADVLNNVCLIEGDIIHNFIINNPLEMYEGFAFAWDGIFAVAKAALKRGVDVVIDYVVEDEYDAIKEEFAGYPVRLCQLTAPDEVILNRLTKRGDPESLERSLFLKNKIASFEHFRKHIFDNGESDAHNTAKIILADERFVIK